MTLSQGLGASDKLDHLMAHVGGYNLHSDFLSKKYVGKTIPNHHFYRWYNRNHSQSWVVYDIVLPTLLEFSLFQGDPEVC